MNRSYLQVSWQDMKYVRYVSMKLAHFGERICQNRNQYPQMKVSVMKIVKLSFRLIWNEQGDTWLSLPLNMRKSLYPRRLEALSQSSKGLYQLRVTYPVLSPILIVNIQTSESSAITLRSVNLSWRHHYEVASFTPVNVPINWRYLPP